MGNLNQSRGSPRDRQPGNHDEERLEVHGFTQRFFQVSTPRPRSVNAEFLVFKNLLGSIFCIYAVSAMIRIN